MAIIKNNMPRVIVTGIKDESIVPLVPELEQYPIHMPIIYTISERGTEIPFIAGGGDAIRVLGDKTFDVRSKYYSHATAMIENIMNEGNSVFIKRLIPADSVISSLTLVATTDTAPGVINKFERDVNGKVVLGQDGSPTYLMESGSVVPVPDGVSLKLEWLATSTFFDSGSGTYIFTPTTTGTTVSRPILTIEAPDQGAYGNNVGIRLFTPRTGTKFEADGDVIEDQDSLMFNAQLILKQSNGTPVIAEDLYNNNTQEFMFKDGAFDYKTNVDLGINRLVSNYYDNGVLAGTSPTYGPVGAISVKEDNLTSLLDQLLVAENANTTDGFTLKYMLDILQGIDVNGNHHYGFQMDSDGDKMSYGITYYMLGGSDGDISSMDDLVDIEVDTNYKNSKYPLVDGPQFPFSAIIDSGYRTSTKKKLMKWLSYRPDVHILIGTHVVGEDPLSVEEEISVNTDLRSSASVFAESDVHGTGVTRLVIMGQSGVMGTHKYKEVVPTTFDIAKKRARYMGSPFMKTGLGYDQYPLNTFIDMTEISNPWMSMVARSKAWLNGLNYAQYADRTTLFHAAIQTVYSLRQSVLTSDMTMQIACDVTKQSEKVWTIMSGDTSLTNAQFIEESDRLLLELVAGKYDGRVIITPTTYFTAADAARGYSWTQDIVIEANVMRTVGTVNVIVRRRG